MKKIMILGAGIYQVPLIKTAKKNNLYTIVVSIPGDYPGFEIADEVAFLDTTDYKGVCELAIEKKIDAIVTTGTDVALITIGYVCDKLHLNGISYKTARLVTDKSLMKEAFEQHGVCSAKHKTVYAMEDAVMAASEIGYPVMVKIVDKSGSRGITRVETKDELIEAYKYGEKITNADHMIVEKYISGREIGIDAFVQDGKLKFFLPHDKLVYQTKRTCIPMGHICPIEMSNTLYDELHHQTKLAIEALSLDNCAVNMDVFITEDDRVFVIEATGRCGATGIPEVISEYTGIDYYQVMLQNSLGECVEFPEEQDLKCAVASVLLFSESSGKLESIECDRDVPVTFDYQKGQTIHEVENGTDRIGMAIIKSQSFTELVDRIDSFKRSVIVTLAKE